MWEFLKELVVSSVSLWVGVLIAVGILPEPSPAAVAPVAIEEVATSTAATTSTPAKEPAQAQPAPKNPSSPSSSSPTPKPLIDDYDKSLKEALDALARLEAEQKALQGTVDVNAVTRSAVVNILCSIANAGLLNPISASGVVIDSRGVVLTNAHVAQYFLLKNYPTQNSIDCLIRTGSPASPAYKASLLFISPTWITKNAHKIDDERPTGNGEHDYALLLITGSISGGPSSPLPHLPLVSGSPASGDAVLLAGYPAGFLGGATIAKELYAVSANATVGTLYTFGGATTDLFSIGGSVVAQQGSSGGAVAVLNAASPSKVALTGLIVTSSDAPDTASRDLRAISTEYIIRDFEKERGIPLSTYFERDLDEERRLFELNTSPTLTAALVNVLNQ